MHATEKTSPATTARAVAAGLLLILLILLGHYTLSNGFGIYQDDVFVTAPAITDGMDGALERTHKRLSELRLDTRLLANFVPHLLAATGVEAGGLQGAYLLGAGTFSLVALLLFALVGRLYGLHIGFAAALVFIFYPADLNKIYLMHSFIHWPALAITLGALHLYVGGRYVPAYLLATLCLFYYESAFLPFLGAPLLKPVDERIRWRECLPHLGICLAILGGVFALRSLAGDFRIAGGEHSMIGGGATGMLRAGIHSGVNMTLGTLTSLGSFPYAVLRLVHHVSLPALGAACAGALLAWAGLALTRPPGLGGYRATTTLGSTSNGMSLIVNTSCADKALVRIFWVGIVLTLAGYLLSFTIFPALHLWGRATRVHFAAGIGVALSGGAVLVFAQNLLGTLAGHRKGTVVCALAVGLLVGYFFHVQQEYVRNWDTQRWMWRQVIALAPDAGENTRVFVIDEGLPQESRPIASLRGWHVRLFFRHLYRYPENWKTGPRLFVMPPDWAGRVEVRDGVPYWKMPAGLWWSHWEQLEPNNLIILEMRDGSLVRRTRDYPLPGMLLPLRQPTGAPPRYPTLPLHDLLTR